MPLLPRVMCRAWITVVAGPTIVLATFFFSDRPASAQSPKASAAPGAASTPAVESKREMGLREVLRQASTGNPDLRRERVAVDLAAANILIAEGQFDFVLTADGTFARRTVPPINLANPDPAAGSGAGTTRNLTADLALTRPLETGGSLSLAAQETATGSSALNQSCGLLCTYYTVISLGFKHPLLRGFGTEITLGNLRKNRIAHDVELLNRQARAAVVIRDVVIAYWELGYAGDDLDIRRSAVTLAEEQRKYTQAHVDVGRLGIADLAAVDRAIADRQQDVALAEQALLARALDLERLVGRAVPADFVAITPIEHPSSAPPNIDPTTETTHALESSPQVRALRAGLALSEIDLRTAQALVRPQLDFTGSVGTVGRQLNATDSWAQAARFENINWSAGLVFQMPVQNRAARGTELAARANREGADVELADLELGIRDGIVRMTGAARSAARRAELAREAVGYAQKNLDAERARFDVGRSTNNDVLLRQQELKSAEVQIARAVADLANAETALAALTGDILERYGVVLRGS